MFHLDLRSFNLPLVWLRTQTKDSRFVTFLHWVLQVGYETSCLLGVVVYKLGECVELVFRCYVQLKHTSVTHISLISTPVTFHT